MKTLGMKGKKHTQETKEKMRKSALGRLFSKDHKNKLSLAHKGKHRSEEVKKKLSEHFKLVYQGKNNPRYGIRGEFSPRWKGGITPINKIIRGSLEYRLWRTAVFKRDNYTCIWCGDNRGGNLEADHIKPFAYYPELRFAIDNGRTLCHECHKTTDTYGGKLS